MRYRKPQKGALHIRQVPDLGDELRGWVAANGRKWEYFDERLGIEALVNTLIVDFLSQWDAFEMLPISNRLFNDAGG
jgi:hypothetical protein